MLRATGLVLAFLCGSLCLGPWRAGGAQDRPALAVPPRPAADDTTPPGMVLVEGGPYLMGTTRAEAEALERYLRVDQRQKRRFWKFVRLELVDPRRRIRRVDPFFIALYETTNLQYHYYRKATGDAPPALPSDHPACWRGGRLPGSTQLVYADEVKNWRRLLELLQPPAPKASPRPIHRVWELLGADLQERVRRSRRAETVPDELRKALLRAFNERMIRSREFYVPKYWAGLPVPADVRPLAAKGVAKLTQAQLERFNRAHLDLALRGVVQPGQPPEMKYWPVTGITYFQAKACAAWMGGRLPTEEEWEKAARGPADGPEPSRYWPWGNAFGRELTDAANWALFWMDPRLNREMRPQSLTPVGSFPKGRSPYGLYDMAGNALEMTATPWGPHPAAPPGAAAEFDPPPDPNKIVIKGGAYGEQFKENLRVAFRYPLGMREATDSIGFRVVKDVRVGASLLTRAAADLFQALYDPRITRFDTLRGLAAAEQVDYDQTNPSVPVVASYRWLGFLTIRDHLFSTLKDLERLSERTKRKKWEGRIFLGVFHTDLAFAQPPLKPGNYAIAFQKGFRVVPGAETANGRKAGPKPGADRERRERKAKRGTKKGPLPKRARAAKKGGAKAGKGKPGEKPVQEPAAPAQAKPGEVPRFARVNRILFLDAGGRPVAAIPEPKLRFVQGDERARLILTPATEKTPAAVHLHLAMKRKYEKNRFLVLDLTLVPAPKESLKGWRVAR